MWIPARRIKACKRQGAGRALFSARRAEDDRRSGRFVGAKEARGEYLLFLDGDMQLQPGFAEKALMAIAAKGYDGVCGVREDVYLRGGRLSAGTTIISAARRSASRRYSAAR
ncbi:MAG: glycosyltransferase [Christensenellales bacterium]